MTLEPFMSSLVVTLGLRGAQKKALEMIRSGCICVPKTHAGALDYSGTLLVFVGGDFGLERGSKKRAGGPHF